MERIDLNRKTFNSNTNYHVILNHVPPYGYLQGSPSEIRGAKYHLVEIIRDPSGVDLEKSFAFQKPYAQAICNALEVRFQDNHVVYTFKISNLSNMASNRVGLSYWDVTN
jgi:hypothetical protein